MKKAGYGVSAAVLTPRLADGSVDAPLYRSCSNFFCKGISSFALNGATGEFCITTPTQLRTLLTTAKEVAGDSAKILCGIGAADSCSRCCSPVSRRKREWRAYCCPCPTSFLTSRAIWSNSVEAGGNVSLPVLLYNLPQFTSGLQKGTVHTLISEVPNIVGIKDSSGSLEILRYLSEHGWTRAESSATTVY